MYMNKIGKFLKKSFCVKTLFFFLNKWYNENRFLFGRSGHCEPTVNIAKNIFNTRA